MTSTNQKINPADMLVMIALSDGNPGCLQALTELHQHSSRKLYQKLVTILMALDIGGTNIYLLWNDLCERDTGMMTRLLMDIWIGCIPLHVIRAALADPDTLRGLPLGKYVLPKAPWMEPLENQAQELYSSGKEWKL